MVYSLWTGLRKLGEGNAPGGRFWADIPLGSLLRLDLSGAPSYKTKVRTDERTGTD